MKRAQAQNAAEIRKAEIEALGKIEEEQMRGRLTDQRAIEIVKEVYTSGAAQVPDEYKDDPFRITLRWRRS
jgi:hypothetical protein